MKSLTTSDIDCLSLIGAKADTVRHHIAQVQRSTERLNAAITAAAAVGVDTRLLFDRRDRIDQIEPRCTTPALDRAFDALTNKKN